MKKRGGDDGNDVGVSDDGHTSRELAIVEHDVDEHGYTNLNSDRDATLLCGKYPTPMPFIIGQEFCERFCYYGMRSILVLYFTNYFGFTDDKATVYYHTFILLSYLTTIFGGMMADSSLGKYRTILYLSIVYLVGITVVSVTAIPSISGDPPSWAGVFSGLLLIAIGTGGIKPCVAAFGGDQFSQNQQHLLASFFAAFYFSINAGSAISSVITPKLRADVHCFGEDECYSLAFGVPAILLAVATVVFVIGKKSYRNRIPTRNVVLDFSKAMKIAMKHKFSRSTPPSPHWLDPAKQKFGEEFIADIRQMLSVLVLFLPAPLFWALFDQQGSRWTLQAEQMKMFNMGALGRFQPDMMQSANPILVLILIPFFDSGIYPLLRKLRIPHKPLQRMTMGMILCALAFLSSAFLQIRIDASKPHVALHGQEMQFRVVNVLQPPSMSSSPTLSVFASSDNHVVLNTTIQETYGQSSYAISTTNVLTQLDISTVDPTIATPLHFLNFTLQEQHKNTMFVTNAAGGAPSSLEYIVSVDRLRSSTNPNNEAGESDSNDVARVKFINFSPLHVGVVRESGASVLMGGVESMNSTRYHQATFSAGTTTFILQELVNHTAVANLSSITLELQDGGDYSFPIVWNGTAITSSGADLIVDVPPNAIPVLNQLPQYIIMTCGEILFSVTGLELAFAEAPKSMKAVVQAGWLLAVTVGSLIVIVVAEASFFDSQRDEFFFFTGLMGLSTLWFIFLALRYKYKCPESHSRSRIAPSTTSTTLTEQYNVSFLKDGAPSTVRRKFGEDDVDDDIDDNDQVGLLESSSSA
eukprot:m.68744 g.68744  ORF g.68744 m.68744 type:complete len:809 (+) comp8256_c1_seq1:40-2466(+)